ncbi:MAG TPA: class I SAM-dependent methyltransferase, partial [Casimicrobiaceae bacterium]|nr:class I SAM-dependent methyltransferase [Casimicrobiaceae bacterium]
KKKVLDAQCGSGRLLVTLAQRGLQVHGADASAAMLAACEQRLIGASVQALLFRQDLTNLNLCFRYAAAFMANGSFQAFATARDAQRVLQRLKAHLVPPGLLLLDLYVPYPAMHPPAAPLVEIRTASLADGSRITLRTETLVHADARRLDITTRYEKRSTKGVLDREDGKNSLCWYEASDITELLARNGFTDIAIEPSPIVDDLDRRFAVRARRAP